MNANELADELKYIAKVLNMNTDVDTQPIIATASLLLQQQAEIEALKAENKFFKDFMSDVEILRKAQEK